MDRVIAIQDGDDGFFIVVGTNASKTFEINT